MTNTYEAALNEFRDASAAVRRCFGAVAQARELQIVADSQHKTTSNALAEAQARLDRADKALAASREAPDQAEIATVAPVFAAFRETDSVAGGVVNGVDPNANLAIG